MPRLFQCTVLLASTGTEQGFTMPVFKSQRVSTYRYGTVPLHEPCAAVPITSNHLACAGLVTVEGESHVLLTTLFIVSCTQSESTNWICNHLPCTVIKLPCSRSSSRDPVCWYFAGRPLGDRREDSVVECAEVQRWVPFHPHRLENRL